MKWLAVILPVAVWAFACGQGSGKATPCQDPPPCADAGVSAVDLFSRQGCEGAVDSYWCGVSAQKLAQCLRDAQMCLEAGTPLAEAQAAIAASQCADQFESWDTCFANGEAGGGGGFDDD